MKNAALGLGAVLLAAPVAFAAQVPQQKGSPTCNAVWDLGDATAQAGTGKKPWTLMCHDGDPTCDTDGASNGTCVIKLSACVGSTQIAGCTATSLTKALKIPKGTLRRVSGLTPPTALTGPDACGAEGTLTLAIRTKKGQPKPSKPATLSMKTKGVLNRVKVQCLPGTTTPTTIPPRCARDTAGLPASITLKVPRPTVPGSPANGSDLDNGWSGSSHNFIVTSDGTLNYCLTNCDNDADPLCDAAGATGPDTMNGEFFGAPLPLLANNVPVCVVNKFKDPSITGTIDLQSGELHSVVNLISQVNLRLSQPNNVCPRCDNGKCVTGKNDGKACTVDGFATVIGSTPADYNLSTQCPPDDADLAASLDIPLPLTTEVAESKPGPLPCSDAPINQTVADACMASETCMEGVCAGADPKGGIQQACCSTRTAVPCFPTKSGGTIRREGARMQLTPAWGPGSSYPKTATGMKSVATFCIAKTGTSAIDGVTGLPGPGALILPSNVTVNAAP